MAIRNSALTVAAAVCLLGAVSGCTAQSSTVPEKPNPREQVLAVAKMALDAGYTEQYDAMKDGEITFDEYDNSYKNVASCYEASGVGVTTPVINPVDGTTYLFQALGNGLEPSKVQQVMNTCLDKYWTMLSAVYNAVTPATMDEALRVAVISCLQRDGFEVSGDEENLSELARTQSETGDKRRNAVTDCVGNEAFRLYPDLPPINLIF